MSDCDHVVVPINNQPSSKKMKILIMFTLAEEIVVF